LFLLGNHWIGWYLAVAGITSVCGAASSIVIVLLRVYYSRQGVLFGAVFIRVYAKHLGAPWNRKRMRRMPLVGSIPDGFPQFSEQ
jgi:uncharacterized BrkB/YihY/UPF0761 family membrane protein